MTIYSLRDQQEDIWELYPEEIATIISCVDEFEKAFFGIEEFEDRAISHTDMDAHTFEQEHSEARKHVETARALLATHGTYIAQMPGDSDENAEESPVDMVEVHRHVQEAYDIIKNLYERVEKYADHEEGGDLWMPWIDGDQVEKMRHSYEEAVAVYARAYEYFDEKGATPV